ncbi:MAG: hypothetical protein V3U75_08755 [Methylococcaceae bacterium]
MSIPSLNDNRELPDGQYQVSLDEIENRFGCANEQRRRLMQGLRSAATNLSKAHVRKLWIDGSFVIDKENPNDIDGVWETNSQIDLNVLDPVFLGNRDAMKEKYGVDFFPDVIEAGSGLPFPVFFRTNRDKEPKGILVVRLGE